MKKLISLFVTFFTILYANAQFEVGQKALGGSIQFNTNSVKNDSTLSYPSPNNIGFIINPTYSIFKTPTKLIGFGIYYMYNHEWINPLGTGSNAKAIQQTIGLNYFMNKYQKISKNFYFLISWNNAIQYSFSKNIDSSTGEIREKNYQLYSTLSPGLAYKINDRFIIEGLFTNLLALSYSMDKAGFTPLFGERTQNASNSSLNFSSSLNGASLSNIQIGFRYLLRNKK
jgi:hypothetical protein